MKPKSTLRHFLLLAGSSLLAVSSASAVDRYWDVNGTADGFSTVVGTWNTSNNFWNTNSTGTGGSVTNTTSAADDLFFSQATTNTGSVTVSGTQLASSLTFLPNVGPTLTFTGGTIQIGGSGTFSGIRQRSAGAVTISSAITLKSDITSFDLINDGSGLLTIGAITGQATTGTQTLNIRSNSGNINITGIIGNGSGGGNVALDINNRFGVTTLTGANTYTGTTTLTGGLTLSGNNGSISASTGLTLNGGALTLLNTSAQASVNRLGNSSGITSNGGTITYNNAATANIVYAETIGSLDMVRGQTNFVLTNNQGSGGTPTNSQTLTLSGLTRTGSTNTSAITFSSGGGLNTTTNRIQITGYTGGFMAPWATVGTGAGAQTDYAFVDGSQNIIAANITANDDETTWGSAANITLGATATTLSATRTINTLRYTAAAGNLTLGTSTHNLETLGVLNGGSGLLTIQNDTGGTGGLTTPTGGGYLYVTPGSNAIAINAPIKDNGGAVNLVKSGSQTLIVSGTNTYTGGTTINSGILEFAKTFSMPATGTVTVQTGGTLAVNAGGTDEWTNATSGTGSIGGLLAGTGGQGAPVTWNGSVALGINTTNAVGSVDYSGTIANVGTALGITKLGTGTLNLSAENTYTGTTTVTGGILNLTGNRTADAGQISVANGATLGISNGNFSIGNNSFFVGQTSGTSTVNHTAGTVSTGTSGTQVLIGNGSGGGIYNLSGGNLNINRTTAGLGISLGVNSDNPGGTFNLSSGNLTMVPTATLQIGRSDAPANNTTNAFNQSGGTATIGILRMGGNTSGSTGVNSTLNLTGGVFTATTFDRLAFGGTNTALIQIGGTADVTLPEFPATPLVSGSFATIEFDGGVLKNSAASTNYLGNISSAQIKNGGAKFNTTGGNLTITQALENFTGHTGILTKEGDNTLSLSGASTYTGATSVTGGTLQLGSGTATGSLSTSSTITIGTGAVFAVNQSDTVTQGTDFSAAAISGAGGFTQAGAGTTILNTANNYTGTTTVSAGTLNLTGNRTAAAGAITVRSGGTLGISNGNFSIGSNTFTIGANSGTSTVNHTAGTLATGAAASDQVLIGAGASGIYNLSGGALNINSTANTRGILLGVNTGGSGTFNLSGGALTMAAGSSLQIGRSDEAANNTTNAFNQTDGTATIARLRMGGAAGGSTGVISTLSLTGGVFTATTFDRLAFGGTNTALIQIGGTADVTLPAFPSGALGGSSSATIEFNGGVLKNSAASTNYLGNISSARIKNGGAKFNTTAGDITITQPLENFTDHTGSLTKEGINTLTLSGTNTYTGPTTVNAGILRAGAAAGGQAFGNGSAVTLANVAGTSLDLNGFDQTIASLAGGGATGGNVTLGSGTLTIGTTTGTTTFAGIISGSGGLTKSGASTQVLSGTNTFSGKAIVQNGTLSFSAGNAIASADQQLGKNAALDLGVASTSSGRLLYTGGADTLAKNINALGNGSDTIENSGTGLLTLSGTLTKTGTVLTLKGGSNGITVSGVIAGTNGSFNSDLIVDGGNTTLTNANTYEGPTFIINGATLNANAANALPTANGRTSISMDQTGSGTSTLAMTVSQSIASLTGAFTSAVNLNANTLTIGTTTGTTTFAGVISGTGGGLTKDSASAQVLSGTNTYTGATTINEGTLRAGAAAGGQAFGNGSAVTLADVSGAALDLNGFNQTIASLAGGGTTGGNVTLGTGILTIGTTSGSTTFGGVISGGAGGGLTKNGASTQVLSGANTYTGVTTVTAGVLAVNGSLANTSTTIQTGGTLQGSGTIGGSVTIEDGGTLAAGNSIESLGTGTLNFDANSTFAYEFDTALYDGGSASVAGDLTYSSGGLNITAGAILTLNDLAMTSTALAAGSKLTLISYNMGSWNLGVFSYDDGSGLAAVTNNSIWTIGANQWQFKYDDISGGPNFASDQAGSYFTMTVIPEPKAALLGSIGMLLLLRRRR